MFIAVSGPDGAGKTKLSRALCRLRVNDHSDGSVALVAPFVHGKKLAARLAALPASDAWPAREVWMAEYFCRCLVEIAEQVIRPHLDRGGTVVSDKWVDDLRISQEYFGVDLGQWDVALSRLPTPDLTVILDVPVGMALDRLASAGHRGPGSRREYLEHAVARYRALPTGPGWLHLDARVGTERAAERVRELVTPSRTSSGHMPGGMTIP